MRPIKTRFLDRVASSPPSSIGVHNHSVGNMCRAVRERLLCEQVDGVWIPVRQPAPGVFDARLERVASDLRHLLPPTAPVTREFFVESYRGRKRINYEFALQSLLISPLTRRDARLGTFVKAEKTDFAAKDDPAPRIIQPRSARYNIELGIFLRELEHVLYRAIDHLFGHPTVMKGKNALAQAAAIQEAWNSMADPIGIDLDASRWERHVSVDALKWEHSVYLGCYSGHHRDRLQYLLNMQLRNKCMGRAADGVIHYEVEGRRSSGDMNTGCGNVLLMTSLMRAYLAHINVSNYRLINNGDDSVLITERGNAGIVRLSLERWFQEMGFIMKVGPVVDVLEEVSFCQTQPVYNGSCWVMCRNPHTAIAKDCISLTPLASEAATDEWLTAVGQCGLSMAGDLPVFGEFYKSLVREQVVISRETEARIESSGVGMLSRGMTTNYTPPTEDSRVSFWRAFGIDPARQVTLEAHFASLSPGPWSRGHMLKEESIRAGYTRSSFYSMPGTLTLPI